MNGLRASNQINLFLIEYGNLAMPSRANMWNHSRYFKYCRGKTRAEVCSLCLKTHYIPILLSNFDTVYFLVVVNSHLFQVDLAVRVGVCPRCREGWAAVEGGCRPSTAACVASCAGWDGGSHGRRCPPSSSPNYTPSQSLTPLLLFIKNRVCLNIS